MTLKKLLLILTLTTALLATAAQAAAQIKLSDSLRKTPESIDHKLTHHLLMILIWPGNARIQMEKCVPGMSGHSETPHSGTWYHIGLCPHNPKPGDWRSAPPCENKSFDDFGSALAYLFELVHKVSADPSVKKLTPIWEDTDWNPLDPNDR